MNFEEEEEDETKTMPQWTHYVPSDRVDTLFCGMSKRLWAIGQLTHAFPSIKGKGGLMNRYS